MGQRELANAGSSGTGRYACFVAWGPEREVALAVRAVLVVRPLAAVVEVARWSSWVSRVRIQS